MNVSENLEKLFSGVEKTVVMADDNEIAKCRAFMKGYRACLGAEKIASENI